MRVLGSLLKILSVMGLVAVLVTANPEFFGLQALSSHFAQLYRTPILIVSALCICGLYFGIKLGNRGEGDRSQRGMYDPDPHRSSHPYGK